MQTLSGRVQYEQSSDGVRFMLPRTRNLAWIGFHLLALAVLSLRTFDMQRLTESASQRRVEIAVILLCNGFAIPFCAAVAFARPEIFVTSNRMEKYLRLGPRKLFRRVFQFQPLQTAPVFSKLSGKELPGKFDIQVQSETNKYTFARSLTAAEVNALQDKLIEILPLSEMPPTESREPETTNNLEAQA